MKVYVEQHLYNDAKKELESSVNDFFKCETEYDADWTCMIWNDCSKEIRYAITENTIYFGYLDVMHPNWIEII